MGWLRKNAYPRFFELKEIFFDVIFKEGVPAMILFSNIDARDTHYHKVLKQASKELDYRMVYVTTGISGPAENFGKTLGIFKADMPILMILTHNDEAKTGNFRYRYEGNLDTLTVADVDGFINDWEADVIPQMLKSEKPPASQETIAHALVGTTHDEYAYSENDVFIEYYADWCPHCKDLAPHWEKLAEHCSDVPGLKIAKMLATDNESAYIHPSGYPTIAFYAHDLPFGNPPTLIYDREYDAILSKIQEFRDRKSVV